VRAYSIYRQRIAWIYGFADKHHCPFDEVVTIDQPEPIPNDVIVGGTFHQSHGLPPHLGVAHAAPDTLTSGIVSGEAWERDSLTGKTEQQLEAQLLQSHGGRSTAFAQAKGSNMVTSPASGDAAGHTITTEDNGAAHANLSHQQKPLRYVAGALAKTE
jgi:hypothetical protein